jgi:8-oxo-dGTP pyrophosphatase MutT (NUDIX family)
LFSICNLQSSICNIISMLPQTSNELLNVGLAPEVPARPAATTIVVRGNPLQALFMRRSAASTFVPDAWIFPGGAVDDVDRKLAAAKGGDELTVAKLCAARELFEEAGIWVGPPLDDPSSWRGRLLDDPDLFDELARIAPPDLDRFVPTSRWITPVGSPKRYDTWFFLVEVGADAEATPELREGMEMTWRTPAAALEGFRSATFPMVFPTIRNLMAIEPFTSPAALLASRSEADLTPIQPTLKIEDGKIRILLPGEE